MSIRYLESYDLYSNYTGETYSSKTYNNNIENKWMIYDPKDFDYKNYKWTNDYDYKELEKWYKYTMSGIFGIEKKDQKDPEKEVVIKDLMEEMA